MTSPNAHTWACFCFPTTLTSRLSATENDALEPLLKCLIHALCYTHAHCVTGRDRLLVLVLSKSCAIIVFGIQLASSRVDWNRSTQIPDKILFSLCPHVLSRFASVPFHCMP